MAPDRTPEVDSAADGARVLRARDDTQAGGRPDGRRRLDPVELVDSDPAGEEVAPPALVTTADRVSTSTFQVSESPGATPNTVATVCGTVVLSDSEPATARKVLDANSSDMATKPREGHGGNRGVGQEVGRLKGQRVKYSWRYRSVNRSMRVQDDYRSEHLKTRAVTALEKDPSAVVQVGPEEYRVKSESGRGYYRVKFGYGKWYCECDNSIDRQLACYHVYMVLETRDEAPGALVQLVTPSPKRSYTQRWPEYDAAQKAVHRVFDAYLWDLLQSVDEQARGPGQRGHPSNSIRLRLLLAIRKVQLGMTTREVDGLFHLLADSGRWILAKDQIPNSTDSSRLFNQDYVSPILLQLIERVGLLVREIEDDGTVAVDSTGFCTSCRGAYLGETHGVSHYHKWVKCHAIIGTRTHMVLGVRVTAENCNDYPEFIPLVKRIAELGFTPRVVAADKAYLGRSNLQTCADLGFDPKIPFKASSREKSKGCPMWWKQYHQFMLHREQWEKDYHQRSNAEATFSAIKRKLGEPLLSKNELARFNELLAKVLAYNLSVVVHEIFKRRMDPGLDLNTLKALPIERGEGPVAAWDPNLGINPLA